MSGCGHSLSPTSRRSRRNSPSRDNLDPDYVLKAHRKQYERRTIGKRPTTNPRQACSVREKLLTALAETSRVLLQAFCMPEFMASIQKEVSTMSTIFGERSGKNNVSKDEKDAATSPVEQAVLESPEGRGGPEWWVYDATVDLKRENQRLMYEIEQSEVRSAVQNLPLTCLRSPTTRSSASEWAWLHRCRSMRMAKRPGRK
jgi:hypothetical protein